MSEPNVTKRAARQGRRQTPAPAQMRQNAARNRRSLSNFTIYDTLGPNPSRRDSSSSISSMSIASIRRNHHRGGHSPKAKSRLGQTASHNPMHGGGGSWKAILKSGTEGAGIELKTKENLSGELDMSQSISLPEVDDDDDDDDKHHRDANNPNGNANDEEESSTNETNTDPAAAKFRRQDSSRHTISLKHTLHQANSDLYDDDDVDNDDRKLIEEMIEKEFPEHKDHEDLDLFGVIGSCISTPSMHDSYPEAEWGVKDWVEMYGPDQQWHITSITRIDERDMDTKSDNLIEDALFKTHQMINTEVEALRREMKDQKESFSELAMSAAKSKFKNLAKAQIEENRKEDENLHEILRAKKEENTKREIMKRKKEKVAELTEVPDIKRYEYKYDCGYHYKLYDSKFIRAPEEGLRTIFGDRPWLWQQYVLLKYEERVRFSAGHNDDFEELDPVAFAQEFWRTFLDKFEANNPDHPLYNDVILKYTKAREKLEQHLLKPFYILDDIRKGDGWDSFDEASAFTYLSVLGTGFFIPVLCCLIQVIILAILSYDALLNTTENDRELISCPQGDMKARGIIWLIGIFYLLKVVPDSFMFFYKVAGNVNCPYSKMMSLRSYIHQYGEDNTGQVVGYNLDIVMNAGFKAIALILNIYILFNTEAVIDIVLNCIALEFVSEMDEQFVQSTWWDEDKRWIRAGCVELLLRKEIETMKLLDYEIIVRDYGVEMKDIEDMIDPNNEEVVQGKIRDGAHASFKKKGFRNKRKAYEDCVNAKLRESPYMKNLIKLRQIVQDMENPRPQAVREFVKKRKEFGWLAKVYNQMHKTLFREERKSETAMFWKFEKYRTWSYWTYLLYCEDNNEIVSDNPGENTVWKSTAWVRCDFAKYDDLKEKTMKRWCSLEDKYIQRQLTYEIFKFAAKEYAKKTKEQNEHSFFDDIGMSVRKSSQKLRPSISKQFEELDTRDSTRDSTLYRALTEEEYFDHEKKVKKQEDKEREKIKKFYKDFDDFKNYDDFTIKPALEAFKSEVWQTFTFQNMVESWRHLYKRNNYGKILQVSVDWIIRWFIWLLTLLIFPFVVIWVLYFIPFRCMGDEWDHLSSQANDLINDVN
mmetsp:Transcript_26845/g.50881  ORF Transcript_26845/g.50881 Transcript_26845/m.50881 type:complete len:1098 (+) Transcript_26845:151-3444(+)